MGSILTLIVLLFIFRLAFSLIGRVIHEIMSFRHHLNQHLLYKHGVYPISQREFMVFWGALDVLWLLRLIYPHQILGEVISPLYVVGALLLLPPIYAIYWICRRGFSWATLLTALLMLIAAPVIFVTQGVSILLNILIAWSTRNYKGQINWVQVFPS
ncbi:hypothetical protein BZG80_11635 [Salinivibrio sp. MA440]|nr:hypothetical protein BZG80_11635 [Salinivibrio sp. MA440]